MINLNLCPCFDLNVKNFNIKNVKISQIHPNNDGISPSQIPAIKTFEIDNEKSATIAADQMVDLGFEGIKGGYLVLMPKEKRTQIIRHGTIWIRHLINLAIRDE